MPLKSFLYAFIALTMVMVAGVEAFVRLEGLSYLDAMWLATVSITTVGYGDVVPKTLPGRVVTMLLIVSGVGLFTYVLSTLLSGLVEGGVRDVWGRRRMEKKIANLNNHIIVCGAGRVGREVILQLIHEKKKFVVIEKDIERLEQLKADGVLFIAGDATEDKNLLSARVKEAKSVISTMPEDAGNLFITITCKDFNPQVKVVARANRPEAVLRLKRAGADTVISPAAIAGNRMALAAVKPASVAFVQTLIEQHQVNLELEELPVSESSPLAYTELKDSRLREDYNAQLLAIIRSGQTLVSPGPNEKLIPGDLLIIFGPSDELSRLEELVTGEVYKKDIR